MVTADTIHDYLFDHYGMRNTPEIKFTLTEMDRISVNEIVEQGHDVVPVEIPNYVKEMWRCTYTHEYQEEPEKETKTGEVYVFEHTDEYEDGSDEYIILTHKEV